MKGTLTLMMTVVEVKMTTTRRTFGDGEEVDLIDNDDIHIMMQFFLFVIKNEHFFVGFHGLSR